MFTPLEPNNNPTDEPISLKSWTKEMTTGAQQRKILGWLFDRVSCHLMVPQVEIFKNPQHQKAICMDGLEKLNSKLMHATIGISQWMYSSISTYWFNHHPKKNYQELQSQETIFLNQATQQALNNWKTLLCLTSTCPMLCSNLLLAVSDCGGHCDASKHSIWSLSGCPYRFFMHT